MAKFNRPDKLSIEDFDTEEIWSNIKKAVQDCIRLEDTEREIKASRAFVVGSLARGEATKESDMDILISFTGEEFDPGVEVTRSIIANCIMQNPELITTRQMEEKMTGDVDIISTRPQNVFNILKRFFSNNRTGEEFEVGAYELREEKFITIEDVERGLE